MLAEGADTIPYGPHSDPLLEGRGHVKLCPLRRRSRGERGAVKLAPLCRRSRREREPEEAEDGPYLRCLS
jgi:hypothetical protein